MKCLLTQSPMKNEKPLKIINCFLLSYWDFFFSSSNLNYSLSLFLRIGSVFIWFVLSSVHVYALFTFLQNIPSGWKGEFSMLTSNKGGKYRELRVATGGCETLCSSLDFQFRHLTFGNELFKSALRATCMLTGRVCC